MRSHNPDLVVSLSPSPPAFAYNKYLQDWRRWVELGLIDEVQVQVYRDKAEFIKNELARGDFEDLRTSIPVGIGLYTGPIKNAKSLDQIQEEIETVQSMGYNNISFFSWETTFWLLKEGSSAKVKAIFTQLLH